MIDQNSILPEAADGPELELSDEDILDAMRDVPGYVDISTRDFRTIYHLAHGHAWERLFRHISARNLMRTGIAPLQPGTKLDAAARALVAQDLKGLPVVDVGQRVIGMLTETDFLRRLRSDSFLQLLLRMVEDAGTFTHQCHGTTVSEAMCAPVVTVRTTADFRGIVKAFHVHEGRSMPVVDVGGRLHGMLLRKDFVTACHVGDPL
jgi:CBS-domain-containing membrane protein